MLFLKKARRKAPKKEVFSGINLFAVSVSEDPIREGKEEVMVMMTTTSWLALFSNRFLETFKIYYILFTIILLELIGYFFFLSKL